MPNPPIRDHRKDEERGRWTSTTPGPRARVPLWRRPFRLIRGNARAYALFNLATYGLLLIGFTIGMIFPELNEARIAALEQNGDAELVARVFSNPALFGLVILAVNVVRLSLFTIVVPSLVVPFAGLGFFGYWVLQTGITLVPTTAVGWVAQIPHTLTVIIELQAYLMLVLGAYLLGRHWLFPRSMGAKNRRQGYLRGLQRIGLLALPALVLLVIGAIWEAYSLRYLVGPLGELLL